MVEKFPCMGIIIFFIFFLRLNNQLASEKNARWIIKKNIIHLYKPENSIPKIIVYDNFLNF